jgi:hypothetical protein
VEEEKIKKHQPVQKKSKTSFQFLFFYFIFSFNSPHQIFVLSTLPFLTGFLDILRSSILLEIFAFLTFYLDIVFENDFISAIIGI